MKTNKFVNITIISGLILYLIIRIFFFCISFNYIQDYKIMEQKLAQTQFYAIDTRELGPEEFENMGSNSIRINEGQSIPRIEAITKQFGQRTIKNNTFQSAKFLINDVEYILEPGASMTVELTKDSKITVIEGSIVLVESKEEL